MTKCYTLLGTSLLLGTLFVTGCSVKEPQSSKSTTHKSKHIKQQKTQKPSKVFFKKNKKIATVISKNEEKINTLEKKISEMPLGKERAKLVKRKKQIEKKIALLQNQQIENAKLFRISKHKEETKHKK